MEIQTTNIETTFCFSDSLVQYGDGIFETMLASKQQIYNFRYHYDRVIASCQRLQINPPDFIALSTQILAELNDNDGDYFVLKVIISRGEALRGYRTPSQQASRIYYKISPYVLNEKMYAPKQLRICETRLSKQPLLAGMKHNNRLEQVMARRELTDSQYDEGLMLDTEGAVIEGLISNVFIIKDNTIITPDLSYSGVAGTIRAQLLDLFETQQIDYKICPVSLDDLANADEIFLTNAAIGLVAVSRIDTINKTFATIQIGKIRCQINHPCSSLFED